MLFLVETVFTTYLLRHSRIRVHAPRRAMRVSVRRMCLERRAAIGSQGSGFVKQPSIFNSRYRAAPEASATETLQSCSASAAGAVLLHATASIQTPSLRPARPLARRHTPLVLRCTTDSLPLAPSRLAAPAHLRRAVPNNSWCGRAGSSVAFFSTVAARRTTSRWAG